MVTLGSARIRPETRILSSADRSLHELSRASDSKDPRQVKLQIFTSKKLPQVTLQWDMDLVHMKKSSKTHSKRLFLLNNKISNNRNLWSLIIKNNTKSIICFGSFRSNRAPEAAQESVFLFCFLFVYPMSLMESLKGNQSKTKNTFFSCAPDIF